MADVTGGKPPAGDMIDNPASQAVDEAGDSVFDADEGLAAWLVEHPEAVAELKRRIARPVSECVTEEEMLAAIEAMQRR